MRIEVTCRDPKLLAWLASDPVRPDEAEGMMFIASPCGRQLRDWQIVIGAHANWWSERPSLLRKTR